MSREQARVSARPKGIQYGPLRHRWGLHPSIPMTFRKRSGQPQGRGQHPLRRLPRLRRRHDAVRPSGAGCSAFLRRPTPAFLSQHVFHIHMHPRALNHRCAMSHDRLPPAAKPGAASTCDDPTKRAVCPTRRPVGQPTHHQPRGVLKRIATPSMPQLSLHHPTTNPQTPKAGERRHPADSTSLPEAPHEAPPTRVHAPRPPPVSPERGD